MNGLATAQRMYDRCEPTAQWDSEQDRQEAIARLAKLEAEAMDRSMLTNVKNMHDVAADMFDKLSQHEMEVILNCAIRGGSLALAAMQRVILDAKKRAIDDVAEFRAIKAIEEHGK